MIPVEVHNLVHEAALAGYATALGDLGEGKLDDPVRERFGLLAQLAVQRGAVDVQGDHTGDAGEDHP